MRNHTNSTLQLKRWPVYFLAAFLLLAPAAHADILIDHQFNGTDNGWEDRDAGEMSFVDGGNGTTLEGTFAQDIFTPETDAFQLTTGLGDLTQGGVYELTFWAFTFYADTISPSDLIFRFGNGSFTFFRAASVGFNTLSLASVSGWFGGTQSDFDSVLTSTTFVEVQITRNGFDEQTYQLENFTLNGELDDGQNPDPGGPSAVPEPNTISLILFIWAGIVAVRRYRGFGKAKIA